MSLVVRCYMINRLKPAQKCQWSTQTEQEAATVMFCIYTWESYQRQQKQCGVSGGGSGCHDHPLSHMHMWLRLSDSHKFSILACRDELQTARVPRHRHEGGTEVHAAAEGAVSARRDVQRHAELCASVSAEAEDPLVQEQRGDHRQPEVQDVTRHG